MSVGGIGDFHDKDRIETHYYICDHCKKACGIKQLHDIKIERLKK